MPLIGYTCPPWAPTAGEQHDVEHCLGGCGDPCVSPLLLNAMMKAEQRNHHKGAYISATMLTDIVCMRQVVLERTTPFYEVPTRRFWPFRGTMIHSLIEAGHEDVSAYGWLQELRLTVELTYPQYPAPKFDRQGVFTGKFDKKKPLVIKVGGTTDCYNIVRKELWDFKSMADYKVQTWLSSGDVDPKWVAQLNIYRWLISKTPVTPALATAYGVTTETLPVPETLIIQGISMMELPRSGVTYMRRRKGSVTEHPLQPLPVWSLEETEALVRRRALKWYLSLVLGEPAPIADEEWPCQNCPFNGELVTGGTCFPTTERRALAEETKA